VTICIYRKKKVISEYETANNRIQLTVKSVTFFAKQKMRPFLRQLMRALACAMRAKFKGIFL
jgi:hypothetical protein